MKSIYWLRSDLRTQDNAALLKCLEMSPEAVVVFAETRSSLKTGTLRRRFVDQALQDLRPKLEALGLTFLRTEKSFLEFISELKDPSRCTTLFFTKEFAWDERMEERSVIEFCQEQDVQIFTFDQATLIAEVNLPFALKDLPFFFTDFRKKVESNLYVCPLLPPPPDCTNTTPLKERGLVGGEGPGLARLTHYLWETDAIQTYKETRNGMIRFDDSTKLSPWLSTGCVSPRTVYDELKRYEAEVTANDSTYWLLFELLWRDYFKFFSRKYGSKLFRPSGLRLGSSPNGHDILSFESWCEGKTRDPFVNANMKELNRTGWMSNRGRQNVASYLIHDLGIDWTWGADYFERKLIDYDPDSNWGNWLYHSGRGSDPRARKFNTSFQAETYDPLGEYQRRWV